MLIALLGDILKRAGKSKRFGAFAVFTRSRKANSRSARGKIQLLESLAEFRDSDKESGGRARVTALRNVRNQ